MASIRQEIVTRADPQAAWASIRDVGALHRRLVPGFVVDVRLEQGARIVTFGNGAVVKELIVDIDDRARRLFWAAVGGRLLHHNASVQVFLHGDNASRIVWIADLLPDELAEAIGAMVAEGAEIMRQTLDRQAVDHTGERDRAAGER